MVGGGRVEELKVSPASRKVVEILAGHYNSTLTSDSITTYLEK